MIFDTDLCGDCDDVLALGMVHALESRGACRLLAVTISVDHDLSAPFVDAVNTFYGRGNIPIGMRGRGGRDGRRAGSSRWPRSETAAGRDTRTTWPRARSAPGATRVLRAALAAQPDGSVVVVQVGFATNLARLLDSPPDDLSPLPGEELVRAKVRQLSLMAGAFEPIEGNARYREYNVVKDLASSRALAARWPTPMVWSGFEVGIALPYPAVEHRARLRLRRAPPGRRGLRPPRAARGRPPDLGPDERPRRRLPRPRLLRPLAARHRDRRARRIHPVSTPTPTAGTAT